MRNLKEILIIFLMVLDRFESIYLFKVLVNYVIETELTVIFSSLLLLDSKFVKKDRISLFFQIN